MRPDYDAFLYRQLSRRARRLYLFRGEHIFVLEKAVAIETPQLGHATYVFAKPRNMESFLHLYTRVSKDDIRRNQENIGERLAGSNPRAWLNELRQLLGEVFKVQIEAARVEAEAEALSRVVKSLQGKGTKIREKRGTFVQQSLLK